MKGRASCGRGQGAAVNAPTGTGESPPPESPSSPQSGRGRGLPAGRWNRFHATPVGWLPSPTCRRVLAAPDLRPRFPWREEQQKLGTEFK